MSGAITSLNQAEAKNKLIEYGFNEIKEQTQVSIGEILLHQIKHNFIIYLLAAATILSLLVGKTITAYVILAVILAVILVGFIQEYKAEKSIKALKKMMVATTTVIRDNQEQIIATRELVPGDIVALRTGEKIPADCLLLEATELRLNEAILTGEAKEIKKEPALTDKNYHEDNLLFMGTFIINGKGVARVLHTGMNTEFGKIAKMISSSEKELPLQIKINKIAKYMASVALVVSLLTGLIMVGRNLPLTYENLTEIIIVIIALSVSAFPEGFPVVLITTLASGAYRMAKRNAIVNRMSIIETLGETTIICADKTGTITKGQMTVKEVYANNKFYNLTGTGYEIEGEWLYRNKKIQLKNNPTLNKLCQTAVLCNDAKIKRDNSNQEYAVGGSPTEAALMIMAAKGNVFLEDLPYQRQAEIPFSSEKKFMAVSYAGLTADQAESYNMIYVKGAPEIIMELCQYLQSGDQVVSLTKQKMRNLLKINYQLTSQGLRTIALAHKKINPGHRAKFDDELTFLGLVGMEDAPREEVAPALELCRLAGIKVKMITGDNKETALTIAQQIGLDTKAITGLEIDQLTDDEMTKIVNKIDIFARVKPEHKLRIIKALKSQREVVTMTGDGVNDAPALKEAHIGVAMGKNGTDVSRESADLIIKDDNFATIVNAISEGRTIFNNIRKFVTYQLSCNYAELFIVFIGILLNLPLPLLALQILFMNLVTDNMPAITLGFNPSSNDIMKIKPRLDSNILQRPHFWLLILTGTIMGLITLGVFYYALNILRFDISSARTLALITLIMLEIANAFNFRSFRKLTLTRSILVNKYLVLASLASLLLTALIIYTPLNLTFGVTSLPPSYWLAPVLISLSVIFIFDTFKFLNRHRRILPNL